MNKAVIFGVTGQDGSYLLELLLEKEYEVVGVTRRVSTGNTSRIKHLLDHHNFDLVEGDITDYSSVLRIIEKAGPDEVFNLAAMSHVGTSFNQPLLSIDVTCKGCLNILEVIREHSPITKFYQASSSEMFGDALEIGGYDDNGFYQKHPTPYQDEETRFNPQSPYAVAKLGAHNLTGLYRKAYGIFGCCGILFNHESERRGAGFVTKKITKWVAGLVGWMNSRNIELEDLLFNDDCIYSERKTDETAYEPLPKLRLGNLDAKRDWGHARDYVEAMWLMLQQEEPDDYVVATGKTYTVRDFLAAAFNSVGIDDFTPFVVQDKRFMRPSEVPYLRGEPKKAREKLGWHHKISFEDLVTTMVNYDIERLE